MAMITNEQLAEQHRKEQRNQVSLDYAILTLIFRFFGWIVRKLWMVRATVLWSLALIFAISANEVAMIVAVIVGLVALTALGIFYNSAILRLLPFAGDWLRYKRKKEAYEAWYNGAKMLVRMGVLPEDAAYSLSRNAVSMTTVDGGDKVVWELREALDGIPSVQLVHRATEYKSLLNAVRSSGVVTENGGVRVTFLRRDPLDAVQIRDTPSKLDPTKMSVVCAVDDMGEDVAITFGDSAGMVVGGIPGSGKSAGVTSFLLSLALSSDVDLSIIDCKGGDEWIAYGSRASTYIRGDEDLQRIVVFLEEQVDLMRARLSTMTERLGNPNFWDASVEARRAAGAKFQMIVIDECQDLFDPDGVSKEDRILLDRIKRAIAKLVKQGRAAGFLVVLMTQKPTAEALPTKIRDNCGIRVSFRVTTVEMTRAVLGSIPDETPADSRPENIPPARKGGAVMTTEEAVEPVRFLYIPVKQQRALLGGG